MHACMHTHTCVPQSPAVLVIWEHLQVPTEWTGAENKLIRDDKREVSKHLSLHSLYSIAEAL